MVTRVTMIYIYFNSGFKNICIFHFGTLVCIWKAKIDITLISIFCRNAGYVSVFYNQFLYPLNNRLTIMQKRFGDW